MTSFTAAGDAWFITGQTAGGKTRVGIELARLIDAEIISLDSMAVYRTLDIGTAKPTAQEQAQIRHHLLDLVDPCDDFSIAQYLAAATEATEDIRSRGKQVLFVGGTPLYLKALLRGLSSGPSPQWELRRQLTADAERLGSESLHRKLQEIDPVSAARLHPQDTRRIIRAIEVYETTGRPLSESQHHFSQERSAQECRVFVLQWPKEALHRRINLRVEDMFAQGLVRETEQVLERFGHFSRTAGQAVGYREVLEHLRGRRDPAATLELVQTRTRQFAKRQATWFKSLGECRFLAMDEHDSREQPQSPARIAQRIVEEAKA